MHQPAFVFFDLGNVLFLFDRPRSFRQMSAVSGADPGRIHEVVMEGGLQARLERGAIDWGEFHAEFSRRTETKSDAADLALAASDMFTLNVAIVPVIAALERAGCPIGILSNTCDAHWRHLVDAGYAILPGHFSPIVLSHEVRQMKPEPEIYSTAARLAGVPPERIFFCDDLPDNVAAARQAGWDAEVFESTTGLLAALGRRGINLA